MCPLELPKEHFSQQYSSRKEENCVYLSNVCSDRIQEGAPKTNRNLIKGDSIKS